MSPTEWPHGPIWQTTGCLALGGSVLCPGLWSHAFLWLLLVPAAFWCWGEPVRCWASLVELQRAARWLGKVGNMYVHMYMSCCVYCVCMHMCLPCVCSAYIVYTCTCVCSHILCVHIFILLMCICYMCSMSICACVAYIVHVCPCMHLCMHL